MIRRDFIKMIAAGASAFLVSKGGDLVPMSGPSGASCPSEYLVITEISERDGGVEINFDRMKYSEGILAGVDRKVRTEFIPDCALGDMHFGGGEDVGEYQEKPH